MSEPSTTHQDTNSITAAAWGAVIFAAAAVIGLVFAPSLKAVWIVLLVFAVAAVPQMLVIGWRERRASR